MKAGPHDPGRKVGQDSTVCVSSRNRVETLFQGVVMSSSVIFPFQLSSCSLWSSWAGSSSWPSSWLWGHKRGGPAQRSCILQQSTHHTEHSSSYIKKKTKFRQTYWLLCTKFKFIFQLISSWHTEQTMQLLILRLSVTQSALTNNTAILVNGSQKEPQYSCRERICSIQHSGAEKLTLGDCLTADARFPHIW